VVLSQGWEVRPAQNVALFLLNFALNVTAQIMFRQHSAESVSIIFPPIILQMAKKARKTRK
jgi:hypothetical protein